MAIERVKCRECDNMVLPQTAAKYGGLCAPCGNTPEHLRKERRDHERRRASGAYFVPDEREKSSAKRPNDLFDPRTLWKLDADFYGDRPEMSVGDAVAEARTRMKGNIFLVCDSGARLNLSFTEQYGVCEYHNQRMGDFLYARTPANVKEQVDGGSHVVQACPCCGVGTLWFPSRCHMPRANAFEIFEAFALGRGARSAEWLDPGDISHTGRGKG
jgi:hypothetical protein